MKIAMFHNLPAGGAKRFFYEAIKYLSRKHHVDLYILSTSEEDFLNTKVFSKKVYLYKFDLNSVYPGFIGRFDRDYKNFFSLKNIHKNIARDIDSRNYDVVLTWADRFTESPFLLRYLETPSVYSAMELLRIAYEDVLSFQENVGIHKILYEKITRNIRKQIDRKNAQSATRILSPSKFTIKQIKKAYYKDAVLVYGGVDFKIFKKTKKSENKLLFMGGKTDQDGYPLAKSIVEKLGGKLELTQLDFPKGKARINNDRIVSEQYSKAFVTLCLDYAEPFGLKAIESMACETPVLAVNDGGYRESILDGKTGYLLPRDADIFTKKIQYLLKKPLFRRKMGTCGRNHVMENYTWQKHGENLEKTLTDLSKT